MLLLFRKTTTFDFWRGIRHMYRNNSSSCDITTEYYYYTCRCGAGTTALDDSIEKVNKPFLYLPVVV